MTDERLSNCCGAPALNEISDDGFALCAECHDHAEFPPTCPACDGNNMEAETDHDVPRSRGTVQTGWKCLDCGHKIRFMGDVQLSPKPKPERPEHTS